MKSRIGWVRRVLAVQVLAGAVLGFVSLLASRKPPTLPYQSLHLGAALAAVAFFIAALFTASWVHELRVRNGRGGFHFSTSSEAQNTVAEIERAVVASRRPRLEVIRGGHTGGPMEEGATVAPPKPSDAAQAKPPER